MKIASQILIRGAIIKELSPKVYRKSKISNLKSKIALATLLPLMVILTGCTTYNDRFADIRRDYVAGNFEAAAAVTQKAVEAEGESGKDALLWQLEHATILRAAGKRTESEAAFARARDLYMSNLDAAKVRLLRGGAELLTTSDSAPYWGTGYDGIMIDTYQALHALSGGDIPRARVELVRAFLLQQEVVEMNASRIEKEQAEARKDANVSTAVESGKGQVASGVEAAEEIKFELDAYADYVNPFTVYLDALFHATQATSPSDTERARVSLTRMRAFAPNNATVQEDLRKVTNEGRIASGVYVIFETGMAPRLTEEKFQLALPIQHVPYIGFAYPKLVTDPLYVRCMKVRSGGHTVTTERVASMDAVIGREFNNNFPSILTRTIATAVLKAVAAAVANEAARKSDNGLVQVGTWVGTLALQAGTNVADTRSWQTLPKEFQVARVEMPSDRTLTLLSPDGAWTRDMTLIDGDVVVVYAKSIASLQDMTLTQFKLR